MGINIGERRLRKSVNGEWETVSEKIVNTDTLDNLGNPLATFNAPKPVISKPDEDDEPKFPDPIPIGKYTVQDRTILRKFKFDSPKIDANGKARKGGSKYHRAVRIAHVAWGENVYIDVKVNRKNDLNSFKMIFPNMVASPSMGQTLAAKTFAQRFGMEVTLHILAILS